MTEMDSQRDLVRASLDRDNQKDVTPIRRHAVVLGLLGQGLTHEDVGRTLGVSADRVRHVESEAVRRLA